MISLGIINFGAIITTVLLPPILRREFRTAPGTFTNFVPPCIGATCLMAHNAIDTKKITGIAHCLDPFGWLLAMLSEQLPAVAAL